VNELRFIWDPSKAASNRRKHGVSFEEAQSAFADENGLLLDDPDHSEDEDRYVLLGLSAEIRIVVVIHAVRGRGNEIRIISARRATRREYRQYFERMKR